MAYMGIGIIFVSVFLSASMGGGSVRMLVDVSSFVLVTGQIAGFILATGSLKDLVFGVRLLRGRVDSASASREQLERCEILSQTLTYVSPLAGVIGTLTGLILMLANLSDARMIGPYTALALISLLYGGLLSAALFWPINLATKKFRLQNAAGA